MDKYRKVKTVGKGSFGYAVLVQNIADRKFYIMKVIDVSKMDRKQKEEALNEVHVLKAMRHPYIVTYRESFMSKSCLCIVMDYADGGDMYGKIARQKTLGRGFSEEQILDWFVQLCLAMKHIHERKILHRDLKTQNIFLTAKGEIKVGDFGISRVLKSTYDCAQTAIGTPYYLSPEICQEKPYNQKSDIWSLGCILYEITTLRHAFDSTNMKGLVLKILRGNYPPIPDTYSDNLRQLIAEMLQREPHLRPSIKRVLEKEFLSSRIASLLSHTVAKHELTKSMVKVLEPERPPNPQSLIPSNSHRPASHHQVPPVKPQDDLDSSGEQYSQVIQSLQDCLSHDRPEEDSEDPGERVVERISQVDGRPLPGATDADSIYTQMELLMVYLEGKVGPEVYSAYKCIQNMQEEEDGSALIQGLLGPGKTEYTPLLYQVVACEEKYYNC